MGNCGQRDQVSTQNHNVSTQLREAQEKKRKTHTLLLLGTGNSGKSTFLKQLTLIHYGSLADDEIGHGPRYIHDATILQMKFLLTALKDNSALTLQPESQQSADNIDKLPVDSIISPEIGKDIKILWADPAIKTAYNTRSTLAINDSCPYFFEEIDRICASDYKPNDKDILLARIPTTGIRRVHFLVQENTFVVIDVGGQRSERRKWIDCFDHVHGILFVTSINDYDQTLYEENTKNALIEALELFSQVVSSRYFKKTAVILFLNKSDLFRNKIGDDHPLKKCFPEYDGKNTYDDAIDYIRERFKNECKSIDSSQLYFHVTCATDRSNVQRVFDDVQHSVVMKALQNNGLI